MLAVDRRPQKITLVSRTEIKELVGEIGNLLGVEQVQADLLNE